MKLGPRRQQGRSAWGAHCRSGTPELLLVLVCCAAQAVWVHHPPAFSSLSTCIEHFHVITAPFSRFCCSLVLPELCKFTDIVHPAPTQALCDQALAPLQNGSLYMESELVVLRRGIIGCTCSCGSSIGINEKRKQSDHLSRDVCCLHQGQPQRKMPFLVPRSNSGYVVLHACCWGLGPLPLHKQMCRRERILAASPRAH